VINAICFCNSNKIKFHRGSEYDVLKRILDAAKNVNADIMVAITGDAPLINFSGDLDLRASLRFAYRNRIALALHFQRIESGNKYIFCDQGANTRCKEKNG